MPVKAKPDSDAIRFHVCSSEESGHYWTIHFEGAYRRFRNAKEARADLHRVLRNLRDGYFKLRHTNIDGPTTDADSILLESGWEALPKLIEKASAKPRTRKPRKT